MTKGRLALRSDPAEALAVAEEILNDDPTNANAHLLLADAALELGLPRTAILSLEVAFKANPSRPSVGGSACPTVRPGWGSFRVLKKLYQDLLLGDPHDPGLNEKLKNILASRTSSEGQRNFLRGEPAPTGTSSRTRIARSSWSRSNAPSRTPMSAGRLLSDVVSRLAQDPAEFRLSREAAQLHEKRNDHAAAIAAYPDPGCRRRPGSPRPQGHP
jgi:hypothetical protein